MTQKIVVTWGGTSWQWGEVPVTPAIFCPDVVETGAMMPMNLSCTIMPAMGWMLDPDVRKADNMSFRITVCGMGSLSPTDVEVKCVGGEDGLPYFDPHNAWAEWRGAGGCSLSTIVPSDWMMPSGQMSHLDSGCEIKLSEAGLYIIMLTMVDEQGE